MKGIDVSSYQGDIDFEQVKNAGIEFVIIKAGEWNKTNSKFDDNYEGAKAAGLHIGFYWFCDGETIEQIEMEADACIEALADKQFDFPIYMDLENQSQYDLGKDFCSNAVRKFCEKLKTAGYYPGLYVSASWLNSVIDDDIKQKYTLWVADWRGYCGYNGDYGMWQYGAGYVPGINGKTDLNIFDIGYDTDYPGSVIEDGVDLDYAYRDFPLEIVFQGLNNYPELEIENSVDDSCKDVANNINIKGITPTISQDNWFLIDKSGKFTLEALSYVKANMYLVGGGEDGAEWYEVDGSNGRIYDIEKKSRGGCVLKKEIYINGTVECQAIIAENNNSTGTTLKIGNEIYKCTDDGYVQRKSTANSFVKNMGENCSNGENGANGIKTPCGYVGSSGGGGGTYGSFNGNIITVYAGKGGEGAGNGGEVKNNGTDATNYGCGGGSAGFGGFPSSEINVKTHAGKGMGGCIIIEILDGGACNGAFDSSTESGYCGCSCECPHHEFTCPISSETSSNCERETNYKLEYKGDEPMITESTTSSSSGNSDGKSNCGCTETNRNNNSANSLNNSSNCGCSSGENSTCQSCSCDGANSGKKKRCTSFDVEKWGENWLLFNKDGEYSLTIDEDINLKIYLVGGGSDGKDGIYYNRTAYGGDGGRGGCYNVISDIKVTKGQMYITIKIGGRGDYGGTSVIINNNEYCCDSQGNFANDGGFRGVSGKHGFRQAGNGANGIETPFGYIGSSGGGGAAYCNLESTSRGQGGLYAGNGGKIINGKSTHGDNATGYGCGGGGGAASPTSWCEGGSGKQGCVIITW